jgi:hypothetical protein
MGKKELVKILDREFSLYVRMKAANDNGLVRCPTCGKVYPWRQMDLSHYCGRKFYATRWDERNCIAQCQSENRFQSGNIFLLRRVLVNRYGDEEIKAVEELAKKPWAEDILSLRMRIIEFREKIKTLKMEKMI